MDCLHIGEINAYDLRKSKYRYLRGPSELIEKCEAMFPYSCLMPSGNAAIDLVVSHFKPNSVWHPRNLYHETLEFIEARQLKYNDVNPDMVIMDIPSFSGTIEKNLFPDVLTIVDNSLDPYIKVDADILVTSFSKHFTKAKTVLGAIISDDEDLIERMRFERSCFGNTVFDFQCQILLDNYDENYFHIVKEKTSRIVAVLQSYGIECISIGSIIMFPMEEPVPFCYSLPYEIRPTYGCEKTICSYYYYETELAYFGKPYARISVGTDYSEEKICSDVLKSLKENKNG